MKLIISTLFLKEKCTYTYEVFNCYFVNVTWAWDFRCSSFPGHQGGAQILKLGKVFQNDDHCMFEGTIQHELMHAIGFFHEQSRADRDDYVTIIEDNIQPGKINSI